MIKWYGCSPDLLEFEFQFLVSLRGCFLSQVLKSIIVSFKAPNSMI